MHAPNSVAVAAMLLSAATAMPNLLPRETDIALAPWVTVDDDGIAETVTPVSSTVSGTPTVVSAPPPEITGSVVTISYYGSTVTSSGTPFPAPTGDVAGAFSICKNRDGERAPWCFPTDLAMLNPGKSYYFLWDTGYFAPNATLKIKGNFLNATTGERTDEQAFESSKIEAKAGFWACNIESSFMKDRFGSNITLQITTLSSGGNSTQTIDGPKVYINTPVPYTGTEPRMPVGPALYIGLPTILGFIVLCLVGTCLWNRKSRRIGLGNVMSRGRHGGFPALGKKARQRRANERIQLMQHEVEAAGGQVYRDAPSQPRRDSDALGSLAGTPTEDRQMSFNRPSQVQGQDRNMFRDELKRQHGEKY